ncbi:MAG: hypothetical protein LBL35_03465 [Clostridiales bacterium]|nr:hypothetical protein [Clostridiales bacterium]
MKKTQKLASVILSAVITASLVIVPAYATDAPILDEGVSLDEPAIEEPITDEPIIEEPAAEDPLPNDADEPVTEPSDEIPETDAGEPAPLENTGDVKYVKDYDGLIEALSSVSKGGKIYITEGFDITGLIEIPDGQVVTIAGYEKQVTLKRSQKYDKTLIVVPVNSAMLLTNVFIDASGVTASDSIVLNKGEFHVGLDAALANNVLLADQTGEGAGAGVYNEGVLVVKGGQIINNKTKNLNNVASYGGGVFNVGSFYLNDGGVISGNSASVGGGVYNFNFFEMNGGEIYANKAKTVFSALVSEGRGGGVASNHQFRMNGGKIYSNEALYNGGGVYALADRNNQSPIITNVIKRIPNDLSVSGKTFFALNGGDITDNSAGSAAGGIFFDNYSNNAINVINGGSISGNSANFGASGIYDSAQVKESAISINGGYIAGNTSTPEIRAAYINISGDAKLKRISDVYSALSITGALTNEAYIEINPKKYIGSNTLTASAVIAEASGGYSLTGSDLSAFHSSDPKYDFTLSSDKIYVKGASSNLLAPRAILGKRVKLNKGGLYKVALNASGSKPLTWSVESGTLPKGLSILGEYIVGSPSESGTFQVILKVQNAVGSDSGSLTFEIPGLPTYKVSAVATDGGTVSKAPADKVEKGTTVEITATANPEYLFSKWSVSSPAIYKVKDNVITLTVPASDIEIKAIFVKNEKPAAPTGLKAVAVSASSVTLEWNEIVGATSYEVFWAKSAYLPLTPDDASFAGGSIATSITATSIIGLSGDAPYYFQVRAINAAGKSELSEGIEIYTKTDQQNSYDFMKSLLEAILRILQGVYKV